MATVPGPDPDKPLPKPGQPGAEPEYEPDEEQLASPTEPPSWMPEPYDPEREFVEPGLPVGVP